MHACWVPKQSSHKMLIADARGEFPLCRHSVFWHVFCALVMSSCWNSFLKAVVFAVTKETADHTLVTKNCLFKILSWLLYLSLFKSLPLLSFLVISESALCSSLLLITSSSWLMELHPPFSLLQMPIRVLSSKPLSFFFIMPYTPSIPPLFITFKSTFCSSPTLHLRPLFWHTLLDIQVPVEEQSVQNGTSSLSSLGKFMLSAIQTYMVRTWSSPGILQL